MAIDKLEEFDSFRAEQ